MVTSDLRIAGAEIPLRPLAMKTGTVLADSTVARTAREGPRGERTRSGLTCEIRGGNTRGRGAE